MMKPCLVCGEPTPASRCPDHQLPDTRKRTGERRTARWARLSARLRRMQPFCTACGSRDDLTVDHVVPLAARPDLAYRIDNLQVLCRKCNSRKGTRETLGGDPPAGSSSPLPCRQNLGLTSHGCSS